MCASRECALFGQPVEHYYPHSDSPLNPCESCGGAVGRAISQFGIVWTGDITAKYLDKSKEGGHKRSGAHWAWENGPKHGVGARPVYIENFQQQREYAKRNGMAVPSEMGSNHEVAEDGRTVKNSVGMPGCEI